jgi:hypothetical protein
VGQPKNLEWDESHGQSDQFTPEKRLAVAILVDALRLIHEQHGHARLSRRLGVFRRKHL